MVPPPMLESTYRSWRLATRKPWENVARSARSSMPVHARPTLNTGRDSEVEPVEPVSFGLLLPMDVRVPSALSMSVSTQV